MKKNKGLATNSLEMRNLVRHKIPPAGCYFKDRKLDANRKQCRNRNQDT
jgi:hypothetical protein